MDSDPLTPINKMSQSTVSSDLSNSSDIAEQKDAVSEDKPKNAYISKKTIAEGMFNVALLSSNASQLAQLIQTNERAGGTTSTFHITAITLLVMSIGLQIIVGGCLIVITGYKRCKEKKCKEATRLDDITTILIFLITSLNVLIPPFIPTSSQNNSTNNSTVLS